MNRTPLILAFLAVSAATTLIGARAEETGDAMKWLTLDGKPPLVIAHRGASGYAPEHTLEAYGLAIDRGADVVEPDLVFTRDDVLVARHDRYLSTTTDVADHPEFAARKRANNDPKTEPREDWWVEDFTLAELKTLRARQPFAGRSREFDGLYDIPTFREVLALVARKAKEAGRPVGVYPETKHPAFFAEIGHDFEAPLLLALEGFDAGPVFIQSFEPEILKRLKGKTDAELVQLVFETEPGAGPNIPLAEIATYADGVGAAKELLLLKSGVETAFLRDAHALGLPVHAWTFRNDKPMNAVYDFKRLQTCAELRLSEEQCRSLLVSKLFVLIPAGPFGDGAYLGAEELYFFFGFGVDGVFTDFTDTAVAVRDALTATE